MSTPALDALEGQRDVIIERLRSTVAGLAGTEPHTPAPKPVEAPQTAPEPTPVREPIRRQLTDAEIDALVKAGIEGIKQDWQVLEDIARAAQRHVAREARVPLVATCERQARCLELRAQGLTQVQTAEVLGISQSAVSKWLRKAAR